MKILNKIYNQTPIDSYAINMKIGIVTALLIFVILFRMDINLASEIEFNMVEQELISMDEIIQTEQMTKPPPPPRPPVPVEVPNDEIIDDIDLNLDVSLDLDLALDLPPPPKHNTKLNDDFDETEIFLVVEDDPILIGGLAGLQKSIKYPEIARKAGIEGRVFIQFVVAEDGSVQNPVVTRGVHPSIDEVALEAVKKAKFIPGKQRGKAVKVQYSLPITFRLGN
jgi:protein TonB